jgi:outer membrane murein-binding lipoprotein Lpp
MRTTMTRTIAMAALALAAAVLAGCSSELTDNSAPVELVVTNTQNLSQLDIAPNDDADCDASVGTITMQVIPKNASVTSDFTQVRVTRYRVSYQRTDGGRQVPSPFVRSIDNLIAPGSSGALTNFVILEGTALNQAPFAALLPQNGGRDPDTGQRTVKMDVIVEIFGETLGGDNVYDATRFPLDFCYDCGGCV